MNQPTLFEPQSADAAETERVLLYALGDFQARKKLLAERELALDRLRGAFKRAAEKFGRAELADAALAEHLRKLGARVVEVPNFVAKHPYRVTVPADLAERGRRIYAQISAGETAL